MKLLADIGPVFRATRSQRGRNLIAASAIIRVYLRSCAAHVVFLLGMVSFLAFGRAALAQSSLDDIRSKGELVIATDATYPPFEFKDGNNLRGFDIELGDQIAKELGVKTRWLPMEWTGVMGALETHKCDLVMSGVTITEERKQKGLVFSRPYFLSGQTIARRKGDERIRALPDLKDKRVSVQEETTGQYALQKLGVPKDHIVRFDQLQDGLLDLRNGKSDATVADEPALKDILRKGYPELELTGGIFTHENLGLVMRKGEPELLAAINQALERILADGRYAALYKKWIEPPPPTLLADLDKVKDQGTSLAEAQKAKASAAKHPGSSFAINWPVLKGAMPLLLQGARMTLFFTLLTLVIGIPVGLLIALARISSLPPLKILAMLYVEVVRGTPLLVQIYVIYFVLPAQNIKLSPLVSGIAALSINAAAYISEIFRAGIESIDVGQMEAARSLGMDYKRAMRWVILPQTLRRVLPPLTNEGVALLKDSSLVSVIALSELMRVGKEVATNTGASTTVYLAVALIYLVMTLPLTFLVRRLEAKWQPISRPRARGQSAPVPAAVTAKIG